jgi:hypothetical protein
MVRSATWKPSPRRRASRPPAGAVSRVVKAKASAPRLARAAVGALVVIPLISLAIFGVGRLGSGGERPAMIPALRLVCVFAALPGLLTAGGRPAGRPGQPRRRRPAPSVARPRRASPGVGLAVVGAIPNGVIPDAHAGWAILGLAGLLAGALGGVAIGLACGGAMPTLAELGVWPQDNAVGRAAQRVVDRAMGRRRATTVAPPTPPADPPP